MIVTCPVSVPSSVGVKVVLITQDAPAATVAPHVLVCEKSPSTAMLVMVSVALPVFVNVEGIGAVLVPMGVSPKSMVDGKSETMGAGFAVPVPVRATVCGLSVALSVMVMVPVRSPTAVGVNVVLT